MQHHPLKNPYLGHSNLGYFLSVVSFLFGSIYSNFCLISSLYVFFSFLFFSPHSCVLPAYFGTGPKNRGKKKLTYNS